MLTVLAIDPGPTRSAYAVVRLEGGRLTYLQGGWILNTSPQWDISFQDAVQNRDLGAIEWLHGYAYEAKRVQQLIETAHEEADLRRRALGLGLDLQRITAKEWCSRLTRKATDSDGVIEAVVRALVWGIPKFSAASSEHIFSALGLAVVRLLAPGEGQIVTLPAEVETVLYRAREKQAAERMRKKAKPKRKEIVAQRARRSVAAKHGWAKR